MAALLGAMLWTGCRKEEEKLLEEKPEEKVVEEGYTLTVEAFKGQDTKALALTTNPENSKDLLKAYWVDGEQVAVLLGGTKLGMLSATANSTDNTQATLSGTLNSISGVSNGTNLTLLFPRAEWDYTGQDGSAPDASGTLATKYDYALATVKVDAVSGNTVTTTGSASFANQQSIYRFGFKVDGAGDPIAIKGFTVFSNNNALVRSRSWNGSEWTDNMGSIEVKVPGDGTLTLPFVSLRSTRVGTPTQEQINNKTQIDSYYFSVIGSDDALYYGSQRIPANVMDVHGKFISAQNIAITKSNMAKNNTVTVAW